jgi:5-methylcytosine-specific restriction endonuclease McrA
MSVHSSRGPKWEALRKRVLERDGYVCHWCSAPATEADHIIPTRSYGPGNVSTRSSISVVIST